MSFVNLLEDHDWSDFDIQNRTEAIIAGEFPPTAYAILLRKVLGQAEGYVLTPEEQAQYQRYVQLSTEAGALADAARADMALLRQAWAVERGELAEPSPEVQELVALRGRIEVAE